MPIGKFTFFMNAADDDATMINRDDDDRLPIVGHGPVMTAMAGYPTRFRNEFKRPNFIVRDGTENRNAPSFKRDLAEYCSVIVPWARLIVGPQVLVKTPGGASERKFLMGDTFEKMEDADSDTIFRVTSIIISSNQPAQTAMNTLFRCMWQELEREGDRAFGAEGFSDLISLSLLEGQDIGFAEAFEEDEKERRTTAFVDAMRTSLSGGIISAGSHHGEIFADAIDGKLGLKIFTYRNGVA